MRIYAVVDLLSRASCELEQAPMTQSFASVLPYLECFKSSLLELEGKLRLPHPYQLLRVESTNSLTSDC